MRVLRTFFINQVYDWHLQGEMERLYRAGAYFDPYTVYSGDRFLQTLKDMMVEPVYPNTPTLYTGEAERMQRNFMQTLCGLLNLPIDTAYRIDGYLPRPNNADDSEQCIALAALHDRLPSLNFTPHDLGRAACFHLEAAKLDSRKALCFARAVSGSLHRHDQHRYIEKRPADRVKIVPFEVLKRKGNLALVSDRTRAPT